MFKRFALLMLAWVMPLQAATVTVEVQTEKAQYRLGQTVKWNILAGASSGDNRGVAMLSVSLTEDAGETINLPQQDSGQLLNSEFGLSNNFLYYSPGTKQGNSTIAQIYVMQSPQEYTLDIANDNSLHQLAQGSYSVTTLGLHQLSLNYHIGNYLNEVIINDNTVYHAEEFDIVFVNDMQFGVYKRSDINYDGNIDIDDLSELAAQWLQSGPGLEADIYPANGDGIVDLNDFAQLASDWLIN